MANIWDRNGRKIGEVKDLRNGDQNTYDHNGQPLGKVRKLGTFDKDGTGVSEPLFLYLADFPESTPVV